MYKKIVLTIILSVFLVPILVEAVGFDSTDTFTSDGSSGTDGKTFVNRDLDFTIQSSDIMVACYDWYKECGGTTDYQDCFAANQQDFEDCEAYDSWLTGMGYTTDSTPETQEMSTSNEAAGCIDARYYKNCDGQGGGNLYGVDERQYLIFSRRWFDCDDGVPSWYTYDAEGYVAPSSYDYKDELSCPAYKKCYEGTTGTRDDIWVYTYDGTIPNPCRLDDGSTSNYACSQDGDCWSDDCSGDRYNYFHNCDSDGSDGFVVDKVDYDDSCGGSGYWDGTQYNWKDTTCSVEVGSDYICDEDLEEETSSYDPMVVCRLKEYATCTSSSECWNDNGGYDCMGNAGNKICTTGANGKNCYNNDDLQCDSSRCDTTCQAKLSDGNTCDENSDCTSNICCNNECASSCYPDIDVSPDPLVFDIGQ